MTFDTTDSSFQSHEEFKRRAVSINRYVAEWGAVGIQIGVHVAQSRLVARVSTCIRCIDI